MLFQEALIEKIVQGKKTQTRRPQKDSEELRVWHELGKEHKRVVTNLGENYRTKIECGKDYAVCPGRGKPCVLWVPNTGALCYPDDDGYAEMAAARKHITLDTVFAPHGEGFEFLRIRVLDIRAEDVRKISHNDAVAEGFSGGRVDFWQTWCGFYDPYILGYFSVADYDRTVRDLLSKRPDNRYQAWAYTFEVA